MGVVLPCVVADGCRALGSRLDREVIAHLLLVLPFLDFLVWFAYWIFSLERLLGWSLQHSAAGGARELHLKGD